MAVSTENKIEHTPRVYCLEESRFFLNWIAEGSDGNLYMVPSEPGGWRHRIRYDGDRQLLIKVSEQKARAIMRFVGGDAGWGEMTLGDPLGTQTSTYIYGQSAGAQHVR